MTASFIFDMIMVILSRLSYDDARMCVGKLCMEFDYDKEKGKDDSSVIEEGVHEDS